MITRTPAERAVARQARQRARADRLTVEIRDEVNRRLRAAGVPSGLMKVEPYFDGAMMQRLRLMVHADEEKMRTVGYVALRADIERAIETLKPTLPAWIEKLCHTEPSTEPNLPPSQRFGTAADPDGYEGWVWNFYQRI
jgi:hypothetical protein